MAVTTRLFMYKPVGTDLVDPVAHIADQMAIIDNLACRTLVTNEASPPVASYTGQEWFTRDSHKWFYWTGSAWQQISLPSVSVPVPLGRRAFNVTLNDAETFDTSAVAENGPQLHAEISVTNGKVYRVYAWVLLHGGSLDIYNKCFLRMRVSNGASVVTNTGTLFYQCHGDFSDHTIIGRADKFMVGKWTATFTGTASFGVFLAKESGQNSNCSFSRTSGGDPNFQFIAIEEIT